MSEKTSALGAALRAADCGGRSVLDLACGRGRHALLLAEQGHRVEAVDRDADALAEICGQDARSRTRQADLEGGPWPYHGRVFDGIVVTNYLFRPLLPMLLNPSTSTAC